MKPIQILEGYFNGAKTQSAAEFAERVAFTLRTAILPHNRFRDAITQIAGLHHYSQQNEVGGGLLIIGPSGIGKTTILKHYLEKFPRKNEDQKTKIPVLHVVTPASPTVLSFTSAILVAFGAPFVNKRSAEERTAFIYNLMKSCEVELILIDEFQHFYYAHSILEYRKVSDWLKNLIGVAGSAVVLFGLPEAESVIRNNEQLDRRFSSKLSLTPFSIQVESDFKEFRAALKKFEELLPLPVETPLHEANLARRFLIGSGGLLDYVRKILEGAVLYATHHGHQSLDLGAYEAGFKKEIWSDVGEMLNPFHPKSYQRELNKSGEPFYVGDKRHDIGSALARNSVTPAKEALK